MVCWRGRKAGWFEFQSKSEDLRIGNADGIAQGQDNNLSSNSKTEGEGERDREEGGGRIC